MVTSGNLLSGNTLSCGCYQKEISTAIIVPISKANTGYKNPAWKGGVTSLNQTIRGSTEYALWRGKVFERDLFTCVFCGQKGGRLEADHIKPFSLFPDLRLELSNGRTLCKECHKTTDTYGSKAKV